MAACRKNPPNITLDLNITLDINTYEIPTFLPICVFLTLSSPAFTFEVSAEASGSITSRLDNSRRGRCIFYILNKKFEAFFQGMLFCVMISFHVTEML